MKKLCIKRGNFILFLCLLCIEQSTLESIRSTNGTLSDLKSAIPSVVNDSANETLRWRPHFWSLNRPAAMAPAVPAMATTSGGVGALNRPQNFHFFNKHKVNHHKNTGHFSTVYSEPFQKDDMSTFTDFANHPCRRVCQPGKSLSCYYQLVVHNYQRLGPECQRCQYDANACAAERCIFGDGVPTPIMAVNYMMPGPPIEACMNDTIVIDVSNYLLEPLTLHMHGLTMHRTPEADGVPFVTQYPIQPAEVYRYTFHAERSGTVWYHSHTGWQRSFGVAGAFIIRQTRYENKHVQLYDFDLVEHTLFIQDIFYNLDTSRIRNILINGKGRNHLNNLPDNDSRHRYERLRVTPNNRYRMRVVNNGVVDCPIEFSIENHKLLVISTDGNDIAPIMADSFFMASAERFDFVLDANQVPSNYWIRVRGYNNCSMENLYQGAVLHYRGSSRNKQPQRSALFVDEGDEVTENNVPASIEEARAATLPAEITVVNRPLDLRGLVNKNTEVSLKANNIATSSLRSLEPLPWTPYTQFLTYYSSFGAQDLANGRTAFQIDDITFDLPKVSLLQTRFLYNEDSLTCNRSLLLASGYDCIQQNCGCANMIRLPAYKPIEMVVVNYIETTHPLHLHGYTFRVVGQGIVGNVNDLRRVQDLDRRGVLKRSPPDYPAVLKDTVQIPGLGYVIIRFISNNPGYWFYHCHIEEHALDGMAAIVKVGENNQIKRTPPKIRC